MTAENSTSALVDAEQSCVGAVLLSPGCLDLVPIEAEQFFDPRCRRVWNAILELQSASAPIDVVTIEHVLARQGVLEAVGGVAYLGELAMRVPSADNVEHYAEIVREAATTRAVAATLSEVLSRVKSGAVTGDEAIGESLAAISRIDCGQVDNARTIGQLVKERMVGLEAASDAMLRGERHIGGVATGILKLDGFIGGLQRGIVTIGCGRPGSGKSAFGLTVADNASAAGAGVHLFSIEDTRESYTDRALSRTSRIPAERLRAGGMERADMAQIGRAAAALHQRKGWLIDDGGGMTADDLVRNVRRRRRENGTQLVIVDYLTLLSRPKDSFSLHDAVSQNMNTLAQAAKADKMAYLVFAQLNRELEKRDDKRPRESDLRESGTIEERAKCILGFYRPRMYDESASEHVAEIHVLKNSNGERGVWADVFWDGPTTRLDNLSTRSER